MERPGCSAKGGLEGATLEKVRGMVQPALRDWIEFYVRDQAGGKAVEVPPGARKECLS